MSDNLIPVTTDCWALEIRFDGLRHLVGKHCWPDARPAEPPTRTFPTRAKAREAKKTLTSYRFEARPVRVRITVEERDG